MAALLSRRRALLAKAETVYGTDPVATAADNSIETVGLQITPLDAEYAPLNHDRSALGARAQVLTRSRVRAQFGVYLAGAGDGNADDSPAYHELLRACGFSETATPAVPATVIADNATAITKFGKVTFKPVSTGFDSIRLEAFMAANQHAMRGARGTFEIALNSGELPMLNFNFLGLWVDPATTAAPALDVDAFKPPRPVNFERTPTVTVTPGPPNQDDFVCNRLSIVLNNDLQHIDDPGAERVVIVDREVTGSISIELRSLTGPQINWFTDARNVVTRALKVVHGGKDGATEATYDDGRLIEINAPKVQFTNPRIGESQGRHMVEMDLRFLPNTSAGNDELSLVTR